MGLDVVLLVFCLPLVCLALDNGLDDKDNVEINPLARLVVNPGEFAVCLQHDNRSQSKRVMLFSCTVMPSLTLFLTYTRRRQVLQLV